MLPFSFQIAKLKLNGLLEIIVDLKNQKGKKKFPYFLFEERMVQV